MHAILDISNTFPIKIVVVIFVQFTCSMLTSSQILQYSHRVLKDFTSYSGNTQSTDNVHLYFIYLLIIQNCIFRKTLQVYVQLMMQYHCLHPDNVHHRGMEISKRYCVQR